MLHFSSVLLKGLVSLKYAPSCVHIPESDAIGKNTTSIPFNGITAYVRDEVITMEEENALLDVVNEMFDRIPYNDSHMDDLIHHYKEFYRSYEDLQKNFGNTSAGNALSKARALAVHYLPHIPIDDRVHFLRLHKNGFIRAHVDENRNSTGLIGGLCLGSSRVMTLTSDKFPGEKAELMLARRGFYAIIGRARYDWEHSVDWISDDSEHIKRILQPDESKGVKKVIFEGVESEYESGTRTAIIFRGIQPLSLLNHRMGSLS